VIVPRSLHCAARRAKMRRGGKGRAALVPPAAGRRDDRWEEARGSRHAGRTKDCAANAEILRGKTNRRPRHWESYQSSVVSSEFRRREPQGPGTHFVPGAPGSESAEKGKEKKTQERFIAQKTCDGKTYLATQTPLGMTGWKWTAKLGKKRRPSLRGEGEGWARLRAERLRPRVTWSG